MVLKCVEILGVVEVDIREFLVPVAIVCFFIFTRDDILKSVLE